MQREEILYVVPIEQAEEVRRSLMAWGGQPGPGGRKHHWIYLNHPLVGRDELTYAFLLTYTAGDAIHQLGHHYFNLIVLDNRTPEGKDPADFPSSLAKRFLDRVHFASDPERMYPMARVLALVDEGEKLTQHAFELGYYRISGILSEPFERNRLLASMERVLRRQRQRMRTALCLAGGGLEGLLYEVGVLRALNKLMVNASVGDFDILCGISAGSIAAAALANRISVDDLVRSLSGEPGPLPPVTASVVYDFNFREVMERLAALYMRLARYGPRRTVSHLFRAVPTGFFQGEGIRQYLANELCKEGRTDSFEELGRELYIGATNLDTCEHVTFGLPPHTKLPISSAVRASTALPPFYTPAIFDGTYYVDGQFTRTSNFHLAVERGASLVVIIDPLVPIRVEEPGYVYSKGGVMAGLQGLKALIHTRFMTAISRAAERYPDVDFVLFQPEGDVMRLMSGSPMKYHLRTEIMDMAEVLALRKIRRNLDLFQHRFARHGFFLQEPGPEVEEKVDLKKPSLFDSARRIARIALSG